MYEEIKQLRGLTGGPFGVNLFMPQPAARRPGAVEVYREQLAGEAAWYETPLGDPDSGGDDGYEAKVAILLEDPVPVVSFTFGCPTREVLDAVRRGRHVHRRHRHLGPRRRGPPSGRAPTRVCVQGIEAGGHQGTHRDDPQAGRHRHRAARRWSPQVREAVRLPVIAAGGLMRGSQIAAVLAAGADAAQLGTAFLVVPGVRRAPAAQAGPDQPAVRDAPS